MSKKIDWHWIATVWRMLPGSVWSAPWRETAGDDTCSKLGEVKYAVWGMWRQGDHLA